jgi:mannitol-1-/sugar-/sorbitol-6-/2-deoxyglucose-6-phosphatase
MMEIKAVIFDMDGVLVDSEPLWRIAMVQGFKEAGIEFTEEDCITTTGMRFDEVVKHWNLKRPFQTKSPLQLHDDVIDHLCELITIHAVEMTGAVETLELCKSAGFYTGLATSSNSKIIQSVLKKINAEHYFDAIISAEHLPFGKPHPQVFLNCAEKINVHPNNCLVIEDSVNGVIAAKAAHMKVVAVPDAMHFDDPRFSISDYKLQSLAEFHSLIKKINGEFSATA